MTQSLSISLTITPNHASCNLIHFRTCKSDSALRSFANNYRPPRGGDKIRAASGPSILPRPEDVVITEPEVIHFLRNFPSTLIFFFFFFYFLLV